MQGRINKHAYTIYWAWKEWIYSTICSDLVFNPINLVQDATLKMKSNLNQIMPNIKNSTA